MACNLTLSGIPRDCAASMGGIVEAYIAPFDSVAGVTKTTEQITAISMASSAKFKKYQFRKGTGNFVSTLNVDTASGTNYVSTDIVLQFGKMETSKRIEINALAQSDLVMIVKDANSRYWLFGEYEPVMATAGEGNTGTARGDANAYSITLQDTAPCFPTEILVGEGGVNLDSIID